MAGGEGKDSLTTGSIVLEIFCELIARVLESRIVGTAEEAFSGTLVTEGDKLVGVLYVDIAPILSAATLQVEILGRDFQETAPDNASRTAEILKSLDHVVKRARDARHPLAERAGLQSSAEWSRRALDAANNSNFGQAMRYIEAGLRIEPNNVELTKLREQLTLIIAEGERRRKETRYGQLVNRKYEMGLAQHEEEELLTLYDELARLDEPFYRPLIQNLEARLKL